MTGGLAIPSAFVLAPGEAAASLGNDQDPRLGNYVRRRNYTLGFGLGHGLELFGRLADYQNPYSVLPGEPDVSGPRDLSANLKWQLPLNPRWPKFALGLNDMGGGAVNFQAGYGVVSDEAGPLRWSIGYARSQAGLFGGARSFDGPFAGAELRLFNTRATALLESDGSRRLAGLRYTGEALAWLGQSQIVASVHRSFGATDQAGQLANSNAFNLTLVVPMAADGAIRQRRARAAERAAPLPALPPRDAIRAGQGQGTASQGSLAAVLRAAGLELVRIGSLPGELVLEYENAAYLHNEVDALGVAVGLAAEHAPPDVFRVRVASVRNGLPVLWMVTDVRAWREWLREELDMGAVRSATGFGLGGDWRADDVSWGEGTRAAPSHVRVSLRPLLNYTLGTEFAAFDHSLALMARTSVPLWKGAELYADLVGPIGHSDNVDPDRVFEKIRHIGGLRTLALQQSVWLSPRVFASVGAGRYLRDRIGAEGESVVFLPYAEHSLHLRGQLTRAIDNDGRGTRYAWTGAYRWRITPDTWVEGSLSQYTDGSRGPGAALSRWFGDVKLSAFARKGGDNRFVGLELSLPLAPRRGMDAAPLHFIGTPRFEPGVSTLLSDSANEGNWVRPDAARPADLAFRAEPEVLNAGRVAPAWLVTQLPRLRESFLLHTLGSGQ